MRKIVYYVAISLDGYICGEGEDISGFVGDGTGVEKYLSDLAGYDTVMMGRKTYEFGYRFGLQPGQPAYPHMKHYIFSNTLVLPNADPKVEIRRIGLEEVFKIRQEKGTDIYLCGGGEFAGWLFDNGQIDILKIKLNPLILGKGTRLFGTSSSNRQLTLIDSHEFAKGLQIMTFSIE